MKLNAIQRDGFVLLTLIEDVTFRTGNALKSEMSKALSVFSDSWMAIDVSEVTFLNSAGIGILVEMLKTLRQRGGGVVFIGLQAPIRRLLDKTRLLQDFHTADCEEDVLTLIRQ